MQALHEEYLNRLKEFASACNGAPHLEEILNNLEKDKIVITQSEECAVKGRKG